MHFCKIQKEGAIAISKSLKLNNRLIRLILKSNPIGNEGCHAILASLRKNNSLIVLNLEDCSL